MIFDVFGDEVGKCEAVAFTLRALGVRLCHRVAPRLHSLCNLSGEPAGLSETDGGVFAETLLSLDLASAFNTRVVGPPALSADAIPVGLLDDENEARIALDPVFGSPDRCLRKEQSGWIGL